MRDIVGSIAAENEEAAQRMIDRIFAKTGLLARFPRLGSQQPSIDPEARMLVEGMYLILYRVRPGENATDRVEIVSIVDGRRDLRTLR